MKGNVYKEFCKIYGRYCIKVIMRRLYGNYRKINC